MPNPSITPLVMPKWGLSMKEGTLSAWHVEEGQTIVPGQEIMDVETDKIANAVEAADGGLLRRRVGEIGQVYPVKALLGILAPEDVSDAEIDAFVAAFEVPAAGDDDEDEVRPIGSPRPPAAVCDTRSVRVKAIRSSSSTASAAISTIGCSTSTASPAPGLSTRSTYPGTAARRRRSPIRDSMRSPTRLNSSCRQWA